MFGGEVLNLWYSTTGSIARSADTPTLRRGLDVSHRFIQHEEHEELEE
ncbi:MAG: hypothetical protein R6V25_05865 [Desulfatiglandales bacterium]